MADKPDPVDPTPDMADDTTPIDISQVKTMLNLPETASDIEIITNLIGLIAVLQEKYDQVLSDAVKLEDEVVNRDMSDFTDLITDETSEYWKQQLLTNRASTIKLLETLRGKIQPPAITDPEPAVTTAPQPRIPLRNRSPALRTLATVIESTAGDDKTAGMIRNRAGELRAANPRLSFSDAFTQAELELHNK